MPIGIEYAHRHRTNTKTLYEILMLSHFRLESLPVILAEPNLMPDIRATKRSMEQWHATSSSPFAKFSESTTLSSGATTGENIYLQNKIYYCTFQYTPWNTFKKRFCINSMAHSLTAVFLVRNWIVVISLYRFSHRLAALLPSRLQNFHASTRSFSGERIKLVIILYGWQ